MRKYLNITWRILTLVFLSLILVNCSEDDNPTETQGNDPALIGKWEATEAYIALLNQTLTPADIGYTAFVTFSENGNYEISITEGQIAEIETGTWSTASGVLTMVDSDGTKESLQYTINGNTGVIKNWPIEFQGVEVVADVTFVKV